MVFITDEYFFLLPVRIISTAKVKKQSESWVFSLFLSLQRKDRRKEMAGILSIQPWRHGGVTLGQALGLGACPGHSISWRPLVSISCCRHVMLNQATGYGLFLRGTGRSVGTLEGLSHLLIAIWYPQPVGF